jgi:hypothetical protein
MAIPIDCGIRGDVSLTAQERAQARDSFVRTFERQFSDWTEIARVCIDIKRDRDYLLLGFESWNAWLLNAAPRSRSYLYIVCGRYEELITDIPDQELCQIPLGCAGELRKLSPAARRSSKIRQAARSQPAALREVIKREFPDQHIESVVEKKLKFTASQWDRIEAAYDAYRVLDPTASLEVFFEFCVSEVELGSNDQERRPADTNRQALSAVAGAGVAAG